MLWPSIKKLTEETRENCDFCNFQSYTALDTFGRIESTHTVTGEWIVELLFFVGTDVYVVCSTLDALVFLTSIQSACAWRLYLFGAFFSCFCEVFPPVLVPYTLCFVPVHSPRAAPLVRIKPNSLSNPTCNGLVHPCTVTVPTCLPF